MAVINGTNFLLKKGGVEIGHTTSATLSLSVETPDATTKSSGGFQEVIAGTISGEISFEGLVDFADSNENAEELGDTLLARTEVEYIFEGGATGNQKWTGNGYISSLEISSEAENPVTYSGTIVLTSTIVQADIA